MIVALFDDCVYQDTVDVTQVKPDVDINCQWITKVSLPHTHTHVKWAHIHVHVQVLTCEAWMLTNSETYLHKRAHMHRNEQIQDSCSESESALGSPCLYLYTDWV